MVEGNWMSRQSIARQEMGETQAERPRTYKAREGIKA